PALATACCAARSTRRPASSGRWRSSAGSRPFAGPSRSESIPSASPLRAEPADKPVHVPDSKSRRGQRLRMTSAERREQLIEIARTLFAERGFEGTAIEEVAARAEVSKPIVYEHFGGKEGLYAVVVDREVRQLLAMMRSSLT